MRHRTAEWSMLRVHASFVHSSLRRAMTTWVAYAEERRSAEEKARAVVVRLSPEGRAVGRALNRWSEAGRRRRATLRTLAAVVHRRTVAAVNTWRDVAADATARRRRLSSALHRMTPEGRAQARALARLAAGLEVRRRLRQGRRTRQGSRHEGRGHPRQLGRGRRSTWTTWHHAVSSVCVGLCGGA